MGSIPELMTEVHIMGKPEYVNHGTQTDNHDANGPDTLIVDFADEWERQVYDAVNFEGPDIIAIELTDTRPKVLYRIHKKVAVECSGYIKDALERDATVLRDGVQTVQIGGCPDSTRWSSRETMDFFARYAYRSKFMFTPWGCIVHNDKPPSVIGLPPDTPPAWITVAAAWCFAGFLQAPHLQNYIVDYLLEEVDYNAASDRTKLPMPPREFARMVAASWVDSPTTTTGDCKSGSKFTEMQQLLIKIGQDPWLCGRLPIQLMAAAKWPAIADPEFAVMLPAEFKQMVWPMLRKRHARYRAACQLLLGVKGWHRGYALSDEARSEALSLLEFRVAKFPKAEDFYVFVEPGSAGLEGYDSDSSMDGWEVLEEEVVERGRTRARTL